MELLATVFADPVRVFVIAAFIAMVLLLEGLYLLWNTYKSPEAKQIERRLHALATDGTGNAETSILKQRLQRQAPALQRLFAHLPQLRRVDRVIEQSGLQFTVTRLIALALVVGLAAYLLALALHLSLLPTLALTVGVAFFYVQRRRLARIHKLDRQLPDALDLISRALRAGHSFATGLQLVGEEMSDPIAGEFRLAHEEVNFGVSLQQALLNLAERVPSTDLRYFVIAVLIQRDSGGNLTEVLGNLSTLIRDRFKLLEKVRVLAAEGKLSAWILAVLPFAVALVINVFNPGFMRLLWTDPLGLQMLNGALVLMVLGVIWMRQIIRIHV